MHSGNVGNFLQLPSFFICLQMKFSLPALQKSSTFIFISNVCCFSFSVSKNMYSKQKTVKVNVFELIAVPLSRHSHIIYLALSTYFKYWRLSKTSSQLNFLQAVMSL